MFPAMRRSRQALTGQACEEILRCASHGVLALSGEGGYPYAVPLSFVYQPGRIYFHSAGQGHKIEAIRREEKASFCVVEADRVVPEEYTTYYRSVIAFGRIRLLEGEEEKLAAIRLLAEKYHPSGAEARREEAIRREWRALAMLELQIEHLSGKEAIELTRRRESDA